MFSRGHLLGGLVYKSPRDRQPLDPQNPALPPAAARGRRNGCPPRAGRGLPQLPRLSVGARPPPAPRAESPCPRRVLSGSIGARRWSPRVSPVRPALPAAARSGRPGPGGPARAPAAAPRAVSCPCRTGAGLPASGAGSRVGGWSPQRAAEGRVEESLGPRLVLGRPDRRGSAPGSRSPGGRPPREPSRKLPPPTPRECARPRVHTVRP